MSIHKEGYSILILVGSVLIIINLLAGFLIHNKNIFSAILVFSLIFFAIILQFFRNPDIKVPKNDNHFLSPADGEIVAIELVKENEYFKDERIQVSVFMSPFNVHVNRSPIGGKIAYCKYYPGKYLMAFNPKSSLENERTSIVFTGNNNVQVLIRQIAGFLARRIVYYVKEGDNIEQGDQIGFIKFGSRVDIFLPVNVKVLVKLKQKVKGGETVLAVIG